MRCKLCTPSKTFERRGKNFMDQRGRSGYQVKCRKMSLWTKSYNYNSSFPLSLLAQSYGGQENIWTKFHNFFWYMVWHGIMGIKGRVSIATAFDMKAAYTICMKKIWEYESFRTNGKVGNVCSKEVISCNMYLDGNMD